MKSLKGSYIVFVFFLLCDIGGASFGSPGMMYLPILNEELFRTPGSSKSQISQLH